jgi:hypothetical protein
MNQLPRAVSKHTETCFECGEIIEPGDTMAIYCGRRYCELCVEDYEEEGRPL